MHKQFWAGFAAASILIAVIPRATPAQEDEGAAANCAALECSGLELARAWTEAWNEKDLSYMQAVHHPDVAYIWRGEVTHYDFFTDLLPRIFEGEDGDQLAVTPGTQVIPVGERHQWIYFKMAPVEAEGLGNPVLAVTMLLEQDDGKWRIRALHESGVGPD